MHHCPQTINNHAEICLIEPSPVLVYQISSTCTRVLVDVRGALPKDMKAYFREYVCPQLPGNCFLDCICHFIKTQLTNENKKLYICMLIITVHSFFSEHLQVPFNEAIDSDRIRSMPNNYLPPLPIEKPGVLCLGDAFNMRHPLTGGGMTVALSDVAICRVLFQSIPDLYDYEAVREAARTLWNKRKTHHSFVVNVLAQALYELFAANDGKHYWLWL